MRLYCLSGDPNYPCLVLTAKGCTIMLDCSLNMRTLQYFLPQMLVPNQRFESMPFYRNQYGQQFDNLKEFNNRIYLNSSLEFSVPEFNLINVEDLDAVLISNYNCMLALPYLTKMSGFRATVYCTEPMMQFGKMLMDELTSLVKSNQMIMIENEKFNNESKNNESKYPLLKSLSNLSIKSLTRRNSQVCASELEQPPTKQARYSISDQQSSSNDNNNNNKSQGEKQESLRENYFQLAQILNIQETHLKPINWKYLYSKEDVELCLSKIKVIDFNEKIDIFGSLTAQAKSSGYAIGSCNWTIESDCDNISYLARSSVLNTHSKPFDQLFLKQQLVDCLILTGLNQAPMYDTEQMVGEFCKACVGTIKNQGNVLVPVLPTGKIYDLIECLFRALAESSLSNTPVYFISQVANQSLAYANIFAEWLSDARQNFVYAAECPFNHGELLKNGAIKIFPSINSKFNEEFLQPCIIFASHPSLRFGDACHFIEYWKNSPNNSFIFIEPEYNYLDALSPYQPIYANYYYFPIDTSLNSNQFYKLIKETKSLNQLVSSNFYNKTTSEQMTTTSMIDPTKLNPMTKLSFYSQNEIIKLILKRRYENCDIESDLAMMIMPTKKSNDNQTAYTTFKAQLVTKNNYHVLKAAPKTIPLTRRDRLNEGNLRKYSYGKLNMEKFLNLLKQNGLNQFKLIEKESTNNEMNGVNVKNEADDPLLKYNVADLDNDTVLIHEKTKTKQKKSTSQGEQPNYLIEFDDSNKIQIDLNINQINITCDNEDLRVKIRDSLLKCVSTL